jgi:hypothetical protein
MKPKELQKLQKKALKPMLSAMKTKAPYSRFIPVIGMTTAKSRGVPVGGVRIGVIKNNKSLFPTFSAPALASVIEHGTTERRKRSGESTGIMPPKPWLRESVDLTSDIYTRTFLAEADKLVDKK